MARGGFDTRALYAGAAALNPRDSLGNFPGSRRLRRVGDRGNLRQDTLHALRRGSKHGDPVPHRSHTASAALLAQNPGGDFGLRGVLGAAD